MRGIILAASFSLIAGAAAAQTFDNKTVDSQTVPASKVFPYLDTYLGLPTAERDHFRLAYTVVGEGSPSDVRLTLKRPGGDVPMIIAADGRIVTEPTLADLKSAKVEMTAPKGGHYGIALNIVASEPAAQTLEVAPLKQGVDQARTAARKAAGLLAMAVPDFETVCFIGSVSGQALMADGKSVPLKTGASASKHPNPCLTPVDLPQARQVALARLPTAILITRRPAG